jgi:hypothetical protein
MTLKYGHAVQMRSLQVLSGHFASWTSIIFYLFIFIPCFVTMMKFTLLSLALALCAAQAEVLSLTSENFDSATAGKNIFVKFFAPCT